MSSFPKAVKAPVYEIDGELCRRVPADEAMKNPEAFRASIPITKGKDAGGERIVWFVKENLTTETKS